MTVRSDPTDRQLAWVRQYDAYERLAGTFEKLQRLLRSARNSYATHGRAPEWCGTDLLRGWAFLLSEEMSSVSGSDLTAEWNAVVSRLKDYPVAEPDRSSRSSVASEITLPVKFSDRPKMHRESDFLRAKQKRFREPHVASINRLVDDIRDEITSDFMFEGPSAPTVYVPYVDPDSGGVLAKVLFVLESPSRKAALGGARGSGMLSADNNDETAKNLWEAYEHTGMPRTHGLHWNAVPWFVGTESKNAGVTPAQVERGRNHLLRVLDLAPHVEVVIAFGKPAQNSVQGVAGPLSARGVQVIESIHPGPQNYASPTRDAKARVHLAFDQALSLTGYPRIAPPSGSQGRRWEAHRAACEGDSRESEGFASR